MLPFPDGILINGRNGAYFTVEQGIFHRQHHSYLGRKNKCVHIFFVKFMVYPNINKCKIVIIMIYFNIINDRVCYCKLNRESFCKNPNRKSSYMLKVFF